MPGIFGIVSSRPLDTERLAANPAAMADSMRHRPTYWLATVEMSRWASRAWAYGLEDAPR